MIRALGASALFIVTLAQPLSPASAQDGAIGGAILGGAAGAIIGGAATGRAGGAAAGAVIGAATGAALGADMEARHGGFYWYGGRCYRRYRNGDYYRVARWRCG
jgi:uncharacterized protein YcfJ